MYFYIDIYLNIHLVLHLFHWFQNNFNIQWEWSEPDEQTDISNSRHEDFLRPPSV